MSKHKTKLLCLIAVYAATITGCGGNASDNASYAKSVKAITMPKVNNSLTQMVSNFNEWGYQAKNVSTNGVDPTLVSAVHHHADNCISLASACQTRMNAPAADAPVIAGILQYAAGNQRQAFNLGQQAFDANQIQGRLNQNLEIAFSNFELSGTAMYSELNKHDGNTSTSKSWFWTVVIAIVILFSIFNSDSNEETSDTEKNAE